MLTWYFTEQEGRIVCPEQIVQLTPKAAAVLACLVRRRGEVVSIETFLEEVWPGVHVTPDLVREYISDLRAAFHDDARAPRYIETVRGKGFRLKGGVDVADANAVPAGSTFAREIRPTVAVLKPVASGDDQAQAFGESVAADIINDLARFHDIGVLARHSSFTTEETTDLRAFARDVRADYLLESSFAVFGASIRARFQLIDGESGRHLWAERYDRPLEDVLSLTDELVNAVVNALTGWYGELHRAEFKTVTRKRTEDLNAFEHFIVGTDLELRFDEENIERCLFHLGKSVELDPNFARCWVVYALMLQWASDLFPDTAADYLSRSAHAFERAFTLDPGDPVTLALVALKVAREGNLNRALEILQRARVAASGDADATICVATSSAMLTEDIGRARETFDAAVSMNSTPPSWYYFVEARIAFLEGNYERCIICADSGPSQISALIFRCLSEAMLGRTERAQLAYAELMERYPEADFASFADYFPIANPVRRHEYDTAVSCLNKILKETDENWPRFASRN